MLVRDNLNSRGELLIKYAGKPAIVIGTQYHDADNSRTYLIETDPDFVVAVGNLIQSHKTLGLAQRYPNFIYENMAVIWGLYHSNTKALNVDLPTVMRAMRLFSQRVKDQDQIGRLLLQLEHQLKQERIANSD